jgi:hypothetical protein
MSDKVFLDHLIKSNDYQINRYNKYKQNNKNINFSKSKKPIIPFPCKYHENEFLEPSKECKDSYICAKCKEEKIPGRDGIYGIVEIHNILVERFNNRDLNEKVFIEDEQYKIWTTKSKDN